MSLWNLSLGLHFGFSTISLAKVCIKHLFKETRRDFNPRCGSLCFCLFCSIKVNWCIYHSVLALKFVFVDPSAFSDHWSHSHPACGFGLECGGPGSSLHCGSVYESTSLKRVRVIQQGERRPPTGKTPSLTKKSEFQCKPHQITHICKK